MQITSKSGRKLHIPSDAEDRAINAGIAADADTQELDAAFFSRALPASEVLGTHVTAALETKRLRGRPAGSVAQETKAKVNLRLDPDVLERLRATGKGWQTRVNAALRLALDTGRI